MTHLEWLNVGLTTGQSFNAVLAQTDPGDPFAGFRFATDFEVIGLFRGPLGYVDILLQPGESPQNILDFAALLDIPVEGPPGCCFPGALYDSPNQGAGNTAGMLIYGDFGIDSINHGVFSKDSAFPQVGSLLVRAIEIAQVPAPATGLLLVMGLGLLTFGRRFAG